MALAQNNGIVNAEKDIIAKDGAAAQDALEKFKKDNPRKVSKKLIDDLTKAVKAK